MRVGEGRFFAGALQLDEFAVGIHDQIHVHARGHILGVAQIQQRFAGDDADAHRRDARENRAGGNFFLGE